MYENFLNSMKLMTTFMELEKKLKFICTTKSFLAFSIGFFIQETNFCVAQEILLNMRNCWNLFEMKKGSF